jgi:hypothetical protein
VAGGGRSPLSATFSGALDNGEFGVVFLGSRGKFSGGMDAAFYNKFGGKKTLLFLMFLHNFIRYFYILFHYFLLYFQKTLGGISYNVPAVYDVWAAL